MSNTDIIDGFQSLLDEYGVDFTYTFDEETRKGLINDISPASQWINNSQNREAQNTTISFLSSVWPTLPKVNQALVYDGEEFTILKVHFTKTSPIIDLEVMVQ